MTTFEFSQKLQKLNTIEELAFLRISTACPKFISMISERISEIAKENGYLEIIENYQVIQRYFGDLNTIKKDFKFTNSRKLAELNNIPIKESYVDSYSYTYNGSGKYRVYYRV